MSDDQQPEDLIRYDVLTQDALRDVIRKVLEEVSVAGLPGEHHFFITFHTDHPGVRLSARMRERYPEEMTIVIQHTFWDLKVNETAFEIDLSFDDILERLKVPFSALKGFFDPYVKFGVQFDASYIEAANTDTENSRSENQGNSEKAKVGSVPQVAQAREVVKKEKTKKKTAAPAKAENVDKKPALEEANDIGEGAEIVSLEKFRKKK